MPEWEAFWSWGKGGMLRQWAWNLMTGSGEYPLHSCLAPLLCLSPTPPSFWQCWELTTGLSACEASTLPFNRWSSQPPSLSSSFYQGCLHHHRPLPLLHPAVSALLDICSALSTYAHPSVSFVANFIYKSGLSHPLLGLFPLLIPPQTSSVKILPNFSFQCHTHLFISFIHS